MPTGSRADRHAADMEFESEVRRVASILYPDPEGGARMVDGRERDGIFVTDDSVILIEATRSAEKSKAESDGAKLKLLSDKMSRSHPYKAIRAFFVTAADPTAHQMEAIRKVGQPVTAISYASFKARLVDVRAYFDARDEYAFGSARDPETDAVHVQDSYVELEFTSIGPDSGTPVGLQRIIEELGGGRNVALVGDFGAGKSMTLREIYLNYRKTYLRQAGTAFAISLNLTDHQGQTEPTEALIRHAARIGFSRPDQLVKAWRSGNTILTLDGFDEVFVPGWSAGARPLDEVRRKSVELIRNFTRQSPKTAGILIAGREHFFSDMTELRQALGLAPDDTVASANDFTEIQVNSYLKHRRWDTNLPPWLPRRPLLIGYLAGRRILEDIDSVADVEPGPGWDVLIEAICRRESRIEVGMDEYTIRAILERLASLARRTSSGLGPLGFHELSEVFRELRGSLPDEGAYSVLQRLPSLRVYDSQDNSRAFVDDDLVDALRAGDLHRWLINPNSDLPMQHFADWSSTLGDAGMAVLFYVCERDSISIENVQTAVVQLAKHSNVSAALCDLVGLLYAMGSQPKAPVVITNLHIRSVTTPMVLGTSTVRFEDCIIDILDVSELPDASALPEFFRCYIELVEGASGIDELGGEKLDSETEVHSFSDSAANSSAILRLDITDERRVALMILKKIYAQVGNARREGALFRGSMTQRQRELIPSILESLEAQDGIRKVKRKDTILWTANRALTTRVRTALESPTHSDDPLLPS